MAATCDICDACHDPRCPMGMFHEPDCCGLQVWVEWPGRVLCPDCASELLKAEAAGRIDNPFSLLAE